MDRSSKIAFRMCMFISGIIGICLLETTVVMYELDDIQNKINRELQMSDTSINEKCTLLGKGLLKLDKRISSLENK